jgi:hypothetical protein
VTAPIVVGIDPGPATTGLVVRHRYRLLAFAIVTRDPSMSLASYARLVLDRAGGHFGSVAGRAARVCHHSEHDGLLWAVEDYHTPTPHLGEVAPQQIAETCWLVGYFTAALQEETPQGPRPDAERVELVAPAAHGRQPYGAYPGELITAGERRQPNWRLRTAGRSTLVSHCRSAWDIAGAAAHQTNMAHRTRRTA